MSRRIVMDATPLLFGGAGIGRATQTLFTHLLAEKPDYEFAFYARRWRGEKLCSPTGKHAYHLRAPQRIEGLLQRTGFIEKWTRGDLYHATDYYLPLRQPERAIATVHDMMFLTHPEPGLDTHKRQAEVVPPFIEKCRKIIAISEYTKQDILRCTSIPEERIEVVNFAVDRESFHPETDTEALRDRLKTSFAIDQPYFLAVACSTGRKNTPKLIQAFKRMLKDYPEEKLVLVWNPPEEIKQLCEDSQGKISYTGRVSDQALRDLYCGAKMMCYPSLYEGFGLPVLEAMSCGTPVLTGNNTSLPEVGGDAVMYVQSEDEESIYDCLCQVAGGSVDLPALSAKGFEQVDKFSWQKCAQQTLNVYDSCF